jgi:exodeoxyribonuclease-5
MAPLDAPGLAVSSAAIEADLAARATALRDTGRSLLLEAGAGSGKTSVLAGRVVRLMAEGVPPSAIAAITFTELAASELLERITGFTERLAEGDVPREVEAAFPGGVAEVERANLESACRDLDELACTTIHGFCRGLLTPYPVEAGIDPGASMLDAAAAEILRDETVDRVLRERLAARRGGEDLFAAVYLARSRDVGALLRCLVENLLERRGASLEEDARHFDGTAIRDLRDAIGGLGAFAMSMPAWAPAEFRRACDALAALLPGFPADGTGEADLLTFALTTAVPEVCATEAGTLRKDGKVGVTKKAWTEAGKAAGATKATAERLADDAKARLLVVGDAFEGILPAIAGRVLHVVAAEARAIIGAYAEAKRASAALDFGDLLDGARRLLATRPEVRAALARRHRHLLVDEFQDTDAEQTEVFWRLCGEPPEGRPDAPWREWRIRPGAFFAVGDPQQSIYRFRSADLSVFRWVRGATRATDPDAVLRITRNFRSRPGILEWVNGRFEGPLGREGRCGFAPLDAAVEDLGSAAAIAVLNVACTAATSEGRRNAEAESVARTCAALVGTAEVRGEDGVLRPCRPGDIALLVPGGTELWRYERALEDQGLTVAAQAGKGFFRRQEVQDLIALVRTIADERDRLALGALLRGPLVGLTDEDLLDAVASLPPGPAGIPPLLSLRMDLPEDANPLLRDRLRILQALANQRHATTPHLLLCTAVEEMGVRAILRARGQRVAERALANVDVFLELSRAYAVRGIRAFADAMRAQWEEAQRAIDGRPDADDSSVSLITMHSAKGLEWGVVIPVNGWSKPRGTVEVAYDGERHHLHVPVLGHRSADCAAAFTRETAERGWERERLWYVAATRARDLLVMPRLEGGPPKGSWHSLVEFALDGMECLPDCAPADLPVRDEAENRQDAATFQAEAARIVAATPRIERRTPHLAEADDSLPDDQFADDAPTVTSLRGGFRRGLVLHKLLEEVLTGEVNDDFEDLSRRAQELSEQVVAPGPAPDPGEMAACVARALALEGIADLRDQLIPECAVAAAFAGGAIEEVIFGVADAIVRSEDGAISTVVDWKSDVAPDAATVARYAGQLRAYLRATGATAGLLVLLSTGKVVRILADAAPQ